MPRALLSSRPPTDSVFLQPWIHRTVASLDVCLSDIVIPRLEPNDLSDPLMSPTVLSNCCHFVKISKFCSVDHYHVYAAARDSETQILVEFTPECVSQFERAHHTRITSETVHCVFVVADCHLVFRSPTYLETHWNLDTIDHARTLVVKQATVFDWDQVECIHDFPLLL
ncbi:EST3 (YIL009C-A) [Zygosaccharomyces parabailii]|uniref:Telomere replication protein EST3 n=1 Tax=Zygosaccharomyces bailii (strain CLIB 213 / ATCC 58445 / CBS 680 / BCRC 21525 / NBRC 1098 / NCYC 1416 / NRRL Y-2227) TaxID=1333698 RepID=A0A8J2T551_ZYGB2|nr:EST3 (YIL009C-A) [Zygosaccharomyces parabailii]CDF88141.1 BN860_03268g1_1 [Zygosaccharomyces bailii CLIB 213]